MASFVNELSATRVLGSGLAFTFLYLVYGAVYRLYLSPLAKFPGPKLAALTLWYEFYYDVVKRGQFTWHIRELHKKYGPIIRINPYELHIDDPDYYEELYGGLGKKRDKYAWSAAMFGNSGSMLSTVSHEHHRMRRAALNPYFSKASVLRLEPVIRAKIALLCRRFEDFRRTKEPVNLEVAYAALTTDIITEYSFAKSYGYLERPDFAPEWLQLQMNVSEFSLLNKQFPFLLAALGSAPPWLVEKLDPNMMQMLNFRNSLEEQIKPIMEGQDDAHKTVAHPTIFHELLESDMPASEKTLVRLIDEGQTVVAAGADTSAHFLKCSSYHILANPRVLRKLRAELQTVMPNPSEPAPLRQLEQLPYLGAVVKEGFRLSYGVTARLTRISPDAPLIYDGHVIPAGTPVGMTSVLMHENLTLFPDPKAYRPERWLEPGAHRLEKYLVNFSKGTRACLGLNLAKAEILLTLVAVFAGGFEMELYETDRSDVDVKHDFFNPSARMDSKGVRVLVV